jgi:hypothetical protein
MRKEPARACPPIFRYKRLWSETSHHILLLLAGEVTESLSPDTS